MILLSTVLLVAPQAPAPAATAAPDAILTRLVEAHVRWLGGRDACTRVRDVSLTGIATLHGIDGKVRLVATRTGNVRSETDLGAVRETTVLGPAGAFKVNLSGQVEPLPAEEKDRLAALSAHLLARVWTGDPALRLELRPDEERAGRTWSVIRVQHPGDIVFDTFLDPRQGSATWLRERSEHGDITWTELSDWRETGGVRVPFTQVTELDDGSERARITWQKVEFDQDPAAALFARPAAASGLATFARDATATDWMPITLHLDRYVYLRGTLNGRATDIVLDSGAGATVVDAALADALGLATEGEIKARGVGGTQRASFLPGVEIAIGDLTLRDIQAVKLDMSPIQAMLGRAMPVVLGKEAFHAAVVDLDYPNSRIAFRAPASFSYAGTGNTVPLVAGGDGHRHVEVTIEDGQRGLCTVDTGSGGTLAVFQRFADAHDLLVGRSPLSEAQSGGVGGRIVSKVGTLRSLRFAGYELTNVPATFGSDKRGGAFDNDRLLGNLGAGVFGRFRLVFDYSREVLHVEPGPGWDHKPFRKDRLGLACEWQDGSLVVAFVPPGSPAARAGLTIGTRIASIDGEAIDGARWREALLGYTQVAPGTEVTLRDSEGRAIKLVAAEYY